MGNLTDVPSPTSEDPNATALVSDEGERMTVLSDSTMGNLTDVLSPTSKDPDTTAGLDLTD